MLSKLISPSLKGVILINFQDIFPTFRIGEKKNFLEMFFIQNLKTINFMSLVAVIVESKSSQVRVLFGKSTRFPKLIRA